MTPGDHACAVPVSDEQLWELSAEFVAAGLARNEQVYYFDDGTADRVLGRLADDRVPVTQPLSTGQLAIIPSEVTRQAFRTPVAATREMLAERIDASIEQGYAGFRMTGQLSYGAAHPVGISLVEFDAGLDAVVRDRPAIALCLYDRRRYTDAQIEEMRGVHRDELSAPTAYDDGLLRITRTGLTTARLAGEVDHSNRPMIARLLETTLDDALRSHSASTDIELNLSSLRFLDVAGAVSLVHAAEAFPSTHRLVLSGVRPRIVRVLDRCGAPFAAQLSVREFEPDRDGPPHASRPGTGADDRDDDRDDAFGETAKPVREAR
ncbi:MEDS domain-containing protein [Pseudonocardia sp. H11422]|uniref:MEDS domain-containing protein n=1 Tax=Pseudonocardia sp. H11422 TaxID=2835866 RepID=UPI0020276D73|nr:MEDS domain-containing protein [Pseudonocardia sp. H11422]